MAKTFYLYPRSNGIYYCELIDPTTGKKTTARSTGAKDRDQAASIVGGWLAQGVPGPHRGKARAVNEVHALSQALQTIRGEAFTQDDAERVIEALILRKFIAGVLREEKPEALPLIPFLENFWNYDESPYVLDKRQRGQRIGRRHCIEMLNRVKLNWAPVFEGRLLGEITKKELDSFGKKLLAGLSHTTVNKIILVGTVALRWAFVEGLIEKDPTLGLKQFSGEADPRGVLTWEEGEQVLAQEWSDLRALVGNLLSATTGLRSGEVLALKAEDIEEGFLNVRHSYSIVDGLKAPKNGKSRKVALPDSTRAELLRLAAYREEIARGLGWAPGGFIFYSTIETQPCDGKVLLNGLIAALSKIGIDDETRQSRKIDFHSWRHFYATNTDADVGQLQKNLGHGDKQMTQHYADHENKKALQAFREKQNQKFGALGKMNVS